MSYAFGAVEPWCCFKLNEWLNQDRKYDLHDVNKGKGLSPAQQQKMACSNFQDRTDLLYEGLKQGSNVGMLLLSC